MKNENKSELFINQSQNINLNFKTPIKKSSNKDNFILNETSMLKQNQNNNNQLKKDKSKLKEIKYFKSDFEKFFILFTKLNQFQIDILNATQPKFSNYKQYGNLPIFFSENFKLSLDYEQLIFLNKIKNLNLRRKTILKLVEKPICIENLNLDLIANINQNNNGKNNELIQNNINNNNDKDNDNDKELNNNNISNYNNIINYNIYNENIEFIYENEIPFENIWYSIQKQLKKMENDEIKDYYIKEIYVMKLLNRMTLEDVKNLYENPEWIIEIFLEYKQKLDSENNTNSIKKEEDDEENIIKIEKDKDDESLSEKADNEKKSVKLDAFDVDKKD